MTTVPGGLTSAGLQIEVTPDIRAWLDAQVRGQFGASLPLGDSTLLGFMDGLIAAELGALWQRLQQVYANFDPNQATGPALDQLSLLTGTLRASATFTYTTVYLCGNSGTVISSGSLAATASTGAVFAISPAVTLPALTAWTALTSFATGQLVTNAGFCYVCTAGGLSASSGGPTSSTPNTPITDGTVTWQYVGTGTACGIATATALIAGPTTAVAGDLSVIQTQINGWTTVLNTATAAAGNNADTDQGLRIRREAELAGAGACTKDAVRAALLKLTGISACTVFTNRTSATNAQGLPPFSFSALVTGVNSSNAQSVVDTIANNMPLGIASYGSSSGVHTDSQGTQETIFYQVPTPVTIYMYAFVAYNSITYALGGVGDAAVKTAIATFGASLPASQSVDPTAMAAQAFTVPGVNGCTCLVYSDVIAAPTQWAINTAYVATPGSRSVVVNNGQYFICVQGGTSAASGNGPLGTGTAIVDNTVQWYWLGNVLSISSFQLASIGTGNITVASSAGF